MKKHLQIMFMAALLIFGVGIGSCNKESTVDPCGNNFNFYLALNQEIQAVNTAAQAYSNDPTTANCEVYRSALSDYIDEARGLESCARQIGQGDDWVMEINAAEASLQNLQC